jgi:hypothetical protein
VRQTARLAVLRCQDSKALRFALQGPGENLSQVIGSTTGVRGGRWHGAGLILGRIGINWIASPQFAEMFA